MSTSRLPSNSPEYNDSLSTRTLYMLTPSLDREVRARAAAGGRPRRPTPAHARPITTLAWGRAYLREHFRRPASRLHAWLGDHLDRCRQERGRKINLIGPRGAAKSTIATLAYVLHVAVEAWEPYIWIVSDTKQQAQLHLENVKTELLSNEQLAADYPEAAGRGPLWSKTRVLLRNEVLIESFGTGQRMRGQRYREHRPTLIICDDLQNDSHISSAAQRDATRSWFQGTLLKAGSTRTNVVNLATALHREALAMELLHAPGWTSRLFAAIEAWPTNVELWDEWESIYCNVDDPDAKEYARIFFDDHRAEMEAGAAVLWPAAEDLYTLMQMRVESGHTAFEREKQGSPVDPELCEWPEEYFGDHIWFESWGDCGLRNADCGIGDFNPQSEIRNPKSPLVIKVIALDPSKGRDARRGDYSAYVMLGIDPAGVLYVEADLARRPTPQMVADGVACCARFRPHAFGIEANQYQELLAGEFAAELKRHQMYSLVPAAIHNHVNKQMRIRRLGPLLSGRRLKFLAGSASTRLLVNQLRDFPAAAHDDGPDALEMAVRLAQEVCHGRNADDGLGDRLPVG